MTLESIIYKFVLVYLSTCFYYSHDPIMKRFIVEKMEKQIIVFVYEKTIK